MRTSDGEFQMWMRNFGEDDLRETIVCDCRRLGWTIKISSHQGSIDCPMNNVQKVKEKEIADDLGISKRVVKHSVTSLNTPTHDESPYSYATKQSKNFRRCRTLHIFRIFPPSDYFQFSQLHKYLKGSNYYNDGDVIADVHR
ncbi:hypothetical protein ElyMa_000252900 [Elysia marginata]|uniref:Uncharacterized protein n=1 Tax=Elysia marginata TaxID=1093978 RepID=A0AAV4F364_9GAST|nr:hypothetical protein ElyMa_000252900 [Elysia marginata]